MLAYLLAAVIENTLCYLTMIQSSLHQKGGKSCSSWKSFKHSAQVAYTQHGFCVHVRLVRVNMRQ